MPTERSYISAKRLGMPKTTEEDIKKLNNWKASQRRNEAIYTAVGIASIPFWVYCIYTLFAR
jgi:hypothetical protein